MKLDEVNRLEAWVRDANPVPDAGALVGSEESAAVTLVLSRAVQLDVPGLLPVSPDSHLPSSPVDEKKRLERGRTMDTLERTEVRETKPPPRLRTAAIAFAGVVLVAAMIGVTSLIIDGGEGDVATVGEAAPPDINFVDPEAQIFTYETTIRKLIADTYARVQPLLDVEGVAFAVSMEIFGLPFPDYGVGYSMADPDTVVIGVDPWLPDLGEVLPERLPVMVASALYDVARTRGGASSETFFETMVWSGLADHFAEELLGGPSPPWTTAFPATRNEEFLERAQPLFDTRWDDSQNPELSSAERLASQAVFDDWLHFGTDEIPRWTGLTLGYRLIDSYQAENPGQSAADLVNTPASVFRP